MPTRVMPLGRIAFITTPQFREMHAAELDRFIRQYLYVLCRHFAVLSTGRTHAYVVSVVNRHQSDAEKAEIGESMGVQNVDEHDVIRWRETILNGLQPSGLGIKGMIEITYELVEGRLDAVIHLTDWADVAGKPDSMVLRREANVHRVPIASDIYTATSFLAHWNTQLVRGGNTPLFPKRSTDEQSPLRGLTDEDRVLALISHDAMKLEMCCFVVENATKIFNDFDYILATGTTGQWLQRFVRAIGRGEHEANRIRCCRSGPYGGDVQIAAAVVKGLCRKVIFLQDPFTSHPHETDIRLFEQAMLLFERAALKGVEVELATNVESARAVLGV